MFQATDNAKKYFEMLQASGLGPWTLKALAQAHVMQNTCEAATVPEADNTTAAGEGTRDPLKFFQRLGPKESDDLDMAATEKRREAQRSSVAKGLLDLLNQYKHKTGQRHAAKMADGWNMSTSLRQKHNVSVYFLVDENQLEQPFSRHQLERYNILMKWTGGSELGRRIWEALTSERIKIDTKNPWVDEDVVVDTPKGRYRGRQKIGPCWVHEGIEEEEARYLLKQQTEKERRERIRMRKVSVPVEVQAESALTQASMAFNVQGRM